MFVIGMNTSGWVDAPVAIGIVADREVTRASLLTLLSAYPEIKVLGVDDGSEPASELVLHRDLQLLVVNLPLDAERGPGAGIEYVKAVKRARSDVRVLFLKRRSEEHLLRASLEAGADGCCFAAIPPARLVLAIKSVAVGAAWLDPGILDAILPMLSRRRPQAGFVPSDLAAASARHLSVREHEILVLMSEGRSNDEIAHDLQCSTNTVKTHLAHIFRKLGVSDRVSAVVFALRHELLSVTPSNRHAS
jgi:DNA-binding NarL/FixJ family response regulator